MRRRATGSTRPTSNPPRSRRRCSMTSWIIRASCIAAAAAHEALPADDDGGSVREGGADDVPWVTFECERQNRPEPSTNPRTREIGRAHVRTPVTNAHLVCRLLREKTNMIKK